MEIDLDNLINCMEFKHPFLPPSVHNAPSVCVTFVCGQWMADTILICFHFAGIGIKQAVLERNYHLDYIHLERIETSILLLNISRWKCT